MDTSQIDPNRKYTARDMKVAGFGISTASFVFLGVAWMFASTPDPTGKNMHAAWFFIVTFAFIFVMGIGTLIYGFRHPDGSNSSNPAMPGSTSSPSEDTNTTA